MGKPKLQLSGKQFGAWTVIRDSGQRSRGNVLWLCRCKCGKEKIQRADNMLTGASKSCGCEWHERHGMTSTSTYQCWASMIQRATNPKTAGAKDYVLRGITVCERWRDFKNFLEDMGEKPNGMFIDRIDNNAGYSKENCKWSTRTENNRNRRSCRSIYFRGEFRRLWDIANMVDMKMSVIRNRLNNYFMTIEEAVTIPLNAKPKFYGDYI